MLFVQDLERSLEQSDHDMAQVLVTASYLKEQTCVSSVLNSAL